MHTRRWMGRADDCELTIHQRVQRKVAIVRPDSDCHTLKCLTPPLRCPASRKPQVGLAAVGDFVTFQLVRRIPFRLDAANVRAHAAILVPSRPGGRKPSGGKRRWNPGSVLSRC